MKPAYNLDKIKFGTDTPTFEKAVRIYESGGVLGFKDNGMSGFLAKVRGSKGNLYEVFVSARHYDEGGCDCYLGQNDALCKHMVAVAIQAVKRGEKFSDEEKRRYDEVAFSGKKGSPSKTKLSLVKQNISGAMKYIKPYNGPSRIWFSYQASLSEGCARISKIVSEVPASLEMAKILVDLLLRLDRKISRGVDDSDGTVGGFMEEVVALLEKFSEVDPECAAAFEKLKDKETCFGWEEPLLAVIERPKVELYKS